jgi:hypothetical protein
VREPSDPPVAARRVLEIKMRVGVGETGLRRDPEMLEQRCPHEMGRPAARFVHAEVDVGLAEVPGQELPVAVGEMEQGDGAARYVR